MLTVERNPFLLVVIVFFSDGSTFSCVYVLMIVNAKENVRCI